MIIDNDNQRNDGSKQTSLNTHQQSESALQLQLDDLMTTKIKNKQQKSQSQPSSQEQSQQQRQQKYHSEEESSSQQGVESQRHENHSTENIEGESVVLYQQNPDLDRKPYGNMIVFCESRIATLSIGPNYIFFFLAYACFTMATVYLVGLVNSSIKNDYFKLFNFAFCWLQNLSYLLVALSNPGVVLPKQQSQLLTQQQLKSTRFCKKCRAIQQRKTYHCRECDVCIQDYDHHCPWTSKCIGGNNLNRFYLFVCMTPFYIFYYMVVFMICMASLTVGHNKHLKGSVHNL